jgi:hypothetical protein
MAFLLIRPNVSLNRHTFEFILNKTKVNIQFMYFSADIGTWLRLLGPAGVSSDEQ